MSNVKEKVDDFTKFLIKAVSNALKRDESEEFPKKYRQEYTLKQQCTAIAYHPKHQYFVVALGYQIHFYHLQIGTASILQDEVSQFIDLSQQIDNDEIKKYNGTQKDTQIITTMKFVSDLQNKVDEHILYVGTSSGKLFRISYNYNYIQIIRHQDKLNAIKDESDQYKKSLGENLTENLKNLLNQHHEYQQGQKIWNINYLELHQNQISCILFSDDNQILTSSYDNTIKCIPKQIWEFKDDQNQEIEKICQSLMQPKEAIYWISVSMKKEGFQKQNLISSGYDSFFYLWQRSFSNDKWSFIAKYQRNEVGSRVAYFGQDFLVWQLFQKDYINILLRLEDNKGNKEVGQKIATENIRKLQLNNEYLHNQGIFDNDKFPILQNDELMAIKIGNKIYFLKIIQKFPCLQEKMTIECTANCTEGVLSPDGLNLIVFDSISKQLQVYKVNKQ